MTATGQLWVLLATDPATGAATRPVGVLGTSGKEHYASWIPLAPAAEAWRDRLNAASRIPIAERIAFWVEHANGRALDLAPLETSPDDRQLHDAVEEALDDLLATGVGE